MRLHIDNSAYARANILFGRILPALATICAAWSLVTVLPDGVTRGTVVPILLTILWIGLMIVVYIRRGQHPAVKSIEFLSNQIIVQFLSGTSCFDIAQVRDMEYEGVHNRSRVKVLDAPFPQDAERILVITLSDKTELRARVGYEHDAPLKGIAAQQ